MHSPERHAAAPPHGPKLTLKAALLQGLQWTTASASANRRSKTHAEASTAYDWGYYGAYPQIGYESFGAGSVWPNIDQKDARCDGGYIFIEPRGHSVETPGPVILDNKGNLVWMQTAWGQAMDVKVQRYRGKDYITFWHGSDNGTFGEGYYMMLDETYEPVKIITPVGDVSGDLHEFRITDKGTALMTIYQKRAADMSSYGIPEGWIFDSIFQEVDIASGELLFEWRASDHYAIDKSLSPLNGDGASRDHAFDFFHINSIDKDTAGNYLISSRYMCAVAVISHADGGILWQLGGHGNSFEDLSQGAATNFSWNHHAAWHENNTLTLFDNGSNGRKSTAKFSRGLMIDLDLDKMTATMIHQYVAPQKFLSASQGSVQVLPNGNVLVGWGHVPAFTEFSQNGEVLCETHIGPTNLDIFGLVKNYRTFKYPWIGRPNALPDIAVLPNKKALFVSWNGATEVVKWRLQSGPNPSTNEFRDHGEVAKKTFETRMDIPDDSGDYVRVVALGLHGETLATSSAVSKLKKTKIALLEAPHRGHPIEPFHILCLSTLGVVLGLLVAYYLRFYLRRGIKRMLRRGTTIKYQSLPTTYDGM
ncbi:hypothetical protein G7046_g2865 [Stylonectria norvegica]|nr:hypothetical protein G7046_g2865 [Stylonectria norvegica]